MPAPAIDPRYIFYLEPHVESPLGQQLRCYFQVAQDHLGPTEAQQYPPHCSMVGFFTLDPSQEAKMAAIASACIAECLAAGGEKAVSVKLNAIRVNPPGSSSPTAPSLDAAIRTTPPPSSPSLRLQLDTTGISQIATALRDSLKTLGAQLRPKPADHISLAYFSSYPLLCKSPHALHFARQSTSHLDDHTPPAKVSFNVQQYYDLACSLICKQSLQSPCPWSIVLYREHHSRILDQPHLFEEIQRWDLGLL